MRRLSTCIVFILFVCHSFGQSLQVYTSADIYQQLKKLNVLASVLYIAAHPDDENNALLPYFAKEKLYRTAYLSLTRGDGGQNLIGDEQGIELGMIRTEELLAARKIDGAEQYFTRAYEFGFSKSAEESLHIWGKQKILSDVVWIIRMFQPDIIIKRFPPDARAGHGHHAASAILADEAFIAAADPGKFPEQFKYGVKTWQAKRILWNTYNFGGNNTTSEDQVKIDIGGYNPLIGESYGELGGEARTMHKSQGEGRPRRRGKSYEYFVNTNGEAPSGDLMSNIITTWQRLPGGNAVQKMIQAAIKNYVIDSPALSVPAMVQIYKAIKALPESNWRNKKLQEAQDIIMECSGIYMEATSSQQQVVQGNNLKINFSLIKRETVHASLKKIQAETYDSSFAIPLPFNENININTTLHVADDKKISQPYWLVNSLSGGTFNVTDQNLIGKAWNDPSFTATFTIAINDEDFTIQKPVQYKTVDAVKGEVYEPVAVLPKMELKYDKDNYVSVNNNAVSAILSVQSNNGNDLSTYTIEESVSGDWKKNENFVQQDALPVINKKTAITFSPPPKIENKKDETNASATDHHETYDSYTKVISYNHIPAITYFPKATANLVSLDIKISGKKIGYINGAGDKVPEALKAMGYDVVTLTDADLTEDNLKQYDAIITGIRAYNLNEFLTSKYDVLMHYVQNGGNLIAQYIRGNTVNDKPLKAGPYPFSTNTSSRVTEENAKVTFLLPGNPALNYPNKITEKDFDGWVQERSTYQALQLDAHYETPLGMSDTGEPQSNGSLAIAKFGKGNFVYAALVFFRQLPAGVPGAYRLMANLIALPKN